MYIIFILFFASLLGIIIMIGRKLSIVRSQMMELQNAHPLLHDIDKIKDGVHKIIRRIVYIGLVIMIKLHVKSSRIMKEKYSALKFKVKDKLMKEPGNENSNGEESSGFLKLISDYKVKVRKIKRKIKEEEN